MIRARFHFACLLSALAAGCLGTFTPAQRVQEAAQDLNTATRFGRMDIALERVSRTSRDDFAKRHASWGNRIRIVDCDMQGLLLRDQENADVLLTVAWQRPEETEMRSTTLSQHWKDTRGTWFLVDEERKSGDVGLLGETTVVIRPPPRADSQFESIRIH